MSVSDAVIRNLTAIYVAVIAGIKAYGLLIGRNFGAVSVLAASTLVVGAVLVGTLTWDICRKANKAAAAAEDRRRFSRRVEEMCKGGICWHGVAVKSPASHVRFRLTHPIPYGSM
ncbi:PREDICTED: uncharacterized protein LOC104805018 [Tarenaya hassleriana]|uniref:uncharacterized protein LOC104805018 n=1 Tax=Tarenaya hassleriana TaxID=28532 RepID=UPI00053C5EE6|nr:PREDICTED: uncharacterized protein LOC104805018 [Tarenaya hassleriana]